MATVALITEEGAAHQQPYRDAIRDLDLIERAELMDPGGTTFADSVATVGAKAGGTHTTVDSLLAAGKPDMAIVTMIAAHAPDSIVIVVSNPLDAMVYTAWKVTGFPTGRIVGQAGCLDMARFKAFIAEETGFSVEDIGTLLLGGHGDDMVPLPRFTNISGIPVTEFMSRARLDELVERAKQGGGEIVELLGTSAYYAPAAAVTQMVEAIVRDKKRILPCAGYCAGQYGIEGLFVGVPCVLGAGGMERILEVRLERGEQELLTSSAAHVRELVEVVKRQYPELA